MKYDRTKTEKAALAEIDAAFVVMLGPIEVPYLAFRKSELRRINDSVDNPEGVLDAIYDFVNYRFRGTFPREDYDEFVGIEAAMSYFIDNRGGQKKPATPPETPPEA